MGANLADLVQIAATRRPDVPAIVTSDRTTTWAELERLVRAVSGGLTTRRLDRGDRVAIVLGNSLEFVTTYFGVLRAGLVAVPVNNSYTAREIETVLTSSGARLVIADKLTANAVRHAAGHDIAVIEVGSDDWRRLTVGSTPPPSFDTDPESLAVLIYTAGTSGQPKGAMLTHRSLLANLEQLLRAQDPAPMQPDDVALIVLPMFHIYALNAALGLVAKCGATAVISDRFEPEQSLRMIEDHGVTNVAGAPPMYIAWSAIPGFAERMRNVRMLASGAAPLPVPVYHQFASAGLTIWEGYGMTEAAPVITSSIVSNVSKPGSVGRPVAGLDMKLLDESGNEVEDGDPGEIVVRGPNLFSGYWPDGADGPDASGWFATGDVAIADSDGDIRLVDRRRDLILVSGFNVYPREIETVISAAPGVAEAAVVGVPHPYTGEAVKAIVVARSGIELDSSEVIAFAQQRLARFKTPTIVEIVDELPHSITGKIKKSGLREHPITQALFGSAETEASESAASDSVDAQTEADGSQPNQSSPE